MPNELIFSAAITGAAITGAKIIRGDEVHMSNGRIVIVVELFGDPGVAEVIAAPEQPYVASYVTPVEIPEGPGQPYVPAGATVPEIPYSPAVLGVARVAPVVHPSKWHLEVTNTISECIEHDPRSVDGFKKVRRAIPNAFSYIMGSGFQTAAAGGSAESGMLAVMKQLGVLPSGTIV